MWQWDDEYERAGIPSSFRGAPSSTVVWAAQNWALAGAGGAPRRGLDVGCGTARNAVYLAQRGTRMVGFDASAVAIERARERVHEAGTDVELLVHDLRDRLPAGDGEIDLVLDVFVYKHQLHSDARRRYRAELRRVLGPQGRVLVACAEPGDGYYGSCPPATEAGAGPNAVVDPAIGVGSVLFTLAGLEAEMGDQFALEMAWRKRRLGTMHGREHLRRTLATLWRASAGGDV